MSRSIQFAVLACFTGVMVVACGGSGDRSGATTVTNQLKSDHQKVDLPCAAAWSRHNVYIKGQTASFEGVNYVSNWWNEATEPDTNSGPYQSWTSLGACVMPGSKSTAPEASDPTTSKSPDAKPTTPTPGVVSSYTVGGTVTGLTGNVELQINGANTVQLSADGSFTFPARFTANEQYVVTINDVVSSNKNMAEICSVQNGAGTVSNKAITNVGIACSSASRSGYGHVSLVSKQIPDAPIVSLTTTTSVPQKPAGHSNLFIWPGLQPEPTGTKFSPIGNGVLQPVLAWGNSCAASGQPVAYSTWWIAPFYVNVDSSPGVAGFNGCSAGDAMTVNAGDTLQESIILKGSNWVQTITDVETGKSVTWTKDMEGQGQYAAFFYIESYGTLPTAPVIFTNTTITFSSALPNACALNTIGLTDSLTGLTRSADGTQCSISSMVLKSSNLE